MPKVVSYTKGSIIYFEGDKDERIFILQKGTLILSSKDIESDATITEQIKTGEFFGVKSALGHFPREETATVLTDTTVISMGVTEFEQIFSKNEQVILKMLRVFSSQLRQIHKKTESVMNDAYNFSNPETGMFDVARCFYEAEEFRSCLDVCEKFLARFPNSPNTSEVAKLMKDASLHNDRQRKNVSTEDPSAAASMSSNALRMFDLPTFKRFAKTYEPGQVIISEYEPGDCFYLIQAGEVQLVKCVNGSNKNLDILHPGEFFGEMAILDDSPRSATCLAKSSVECLEFNKENFRLLVSGYPQIALILLKLFCKRIYDQKRRFRILLIKDKPARIADVFCLFAEMNATAVGNAEVSLRKFNTTISDVAHWAGISVEECRDELSKFSERRKIAIYDNYIVVNNINDMRRMVDSYYSMHEMDHRH